MAHALYQIDWHYAERKGVMQDCNKAIEYSKRQLKIIAQIAITILA